MSKKRPVVVGSRIPQEIKELHARIQAKAVALNEAHPFEIPNSPVHAVVRDEYFNRVDLSRNYLMNVLQHRELGPYLVDELLRTVPGSVGNERAREPYRFDR